MAQEGLEFSPGIHILCQLVFVIELQQHGETGAGVDDSTVFEAKLFKKKYCLDAGSRVEGVQDMFHWDSVPHRSSDKLPISLLFPCGQDA